jgi:hypothetical protein
MGRTVTLQFSASSQITYTVDQDSILVGVLGTVTWVLSRDINDGLAAVSSNRLNLNMIGVSNAASVPVQLPAIPIFKDEKLFATAGAAGQITMFLAEPEPA